MHGVPLQLQMQIVIKKRQVDKHRKARREVEKRQEIEISNTPNGDLIVDFILTGCGLEMEESGESLFIIDT